MRRLLPLVFLLGISVTSVAMYKEQHARWDLRVEGEFAPPVTSTGHVHLLLPDEGLQTFDLATSKLQWTLPSLSPLHRPLVFQNSVCFLNRQGELLWVDPSTGKINKKVFLGSIDKPNLVSCASVIVVQNPNGKWMGVDGQSGSILWSQPIEATAPVVVQKSILWVPNGQEISGRDNFTGREIKNFKSPSRVLRIGAGAGRVVVQTGKTIQTLNSETGAVEWTWASPENLDSALAVGSGMVMAADQYGTLYGLNLASGTLAWSYPMGRELAIDFSLNSEVVVASSKNSSIYVLDIKTGREYWRQQAFAKFYGPIEIRDNIFINATSDGRVIAFMEYKEGTDAEGAVGGAFHVNEKTPGREIKMSSVTTQMGIRKGSGVSHFLMRREISRLVQDFEVSAKKKDKVRQDYVVAVLPLNNLAKQGKNWAPLYTELVTDEFANSDSFTTVERQQINDVMREIKFSMTGVVAPGKELQLGKMLAADKIVMGSVAPVGDFYNLAVRMVDTETGILIRSSEVQIRKSLMESR